MFGRQQIVYRDALGRVHLTRKGLPTEAPPQFDRRSIKLNVQDRVGTVVFDGVRVRWSRFARKGINLARRRAGVEYFDADRIGPQVVLRHWRPGDRFQPIGMAAKVKLQDWFTNLKLSRERRRQLVVGAAANGEVFWVEGLRIGEQFKLDKHTVRQLKWRWTRGR
jgi:tRNA(Ile)-lysidine synthase